MTFGKSKDNRNVIPHCWDTGKGKYRKRKQAMTAASMTAKEYGISLTTYKCRICRHWHLTEVKH